MTGLTIQPLPQALSVCKVADLSQVDLGSEPLFIGRTDDETSVVCPTDMVPGNTVERDDGWRAFSIAGQLEFSMVGVLAGISRVLADAGIAIFVVSTYDTDYVLVKEGRFGESLHILHDSGYAWTDPEAIVGKKE